MRGRVVLPIFDFRPNEKKRGHTPPLFFKARLLALRDDPVLKEARSAVKGKGLYLVGGVLRNLSLNMPLPPDYDFVFSGSTAVLASKLAAALHGSAFLLDKDTLSYRVCVNSGKSPCVIDISPVRRGRITADLRLRDFTVDALAIGVDELFTKDEPEVLDPCGGLDDAAKLSLCMVSKGALREDPLRCVRAVRIALQCGLKIASDTVSAVKKASVLLAGVAIERVRDELVHIFKCAGTAGAIEALKRLGVLKVVMPRLNIGKIKGYDLLSHSLGTLDECEALLDEAVSLKSRAFPGLGARLEEHLGVPAGSLDRRAFLKMTAFLHDIGKPVTIKRTPSKLTFIGHDREGAVLARDVLRDLRFSARTAAQAANLVTNHHRAFALHKLEQKTDRARSHFMRAVEGVDGIWRGAPVDLLILSIADVRATIGRDDRHFLKFANELLAFYYERFSKKRSAPLMNGREIMRAFKVREGPLVGEIIKKMEEGIEAGKVKDKKEAVAYVRSWLKGR